MTTSIMKSDVEWVLGEDTYENVGSRNLASYVTLCTVESICDQPLIVEQRSSYYNRGCIACISFLFLSNHDELKV